MITLLRCALIATLAAACAKKEPPVAPATPAGPAEDASGPAGIPSRHAPPADDRSPAGGREPAVAPDAVDGGEERAEGRGGRGGRRGADPAPAPIASPRTPGNPAPPAAAPDGITQVNSREWTISEELLDDWKGSPSMLGNVRQVDGGWELYGIRQRAGYALGMRNGDVITSVNGHQLDTRMQQIGAWFDLRNDETFNVVFLRGGSPYSYTYRAVSDDGR